VQNNGGPVMVAGSKMRIENVRLVAHGGGQFRLANA
jgi:hypothetical protein